VNGAKSAKVGFCHDWALDPVFGSRRQLEAGVAKIKHPIMMGQINIEKRTDTDGLK
jgi:hypothetical protein